MEDLQEQDEMSLRKKVKIFKNSKKILNFDFKIEKKSAEMAQLRKDAQMQLEYKRAELKDKRCFFVCKFMDLIFLAILITFFMNLDKAREN